MSLLRPDTVEVYSTRFLDVASIFDDDWKTEWRWRLRDGYNGQIVANSAEGYSTKQWAIKQARKRNKWNVVVKVAGE